MNSSAAFLAICGALAIGCVSPGPSFIMIATTSLREGRTAGFLASIGMGLIGALYGLLATLGLATLVTASPPLFTALRVVGALYLIWIAKGMWVGANKPLDEAGEHLEKRSPLIRGLATQASNPKTIVIYASVFAAFLPQAPAPWLLVALPTYCGLMEMIWYSVVAVVFSSLRPRKSYLSRRIWIDRIAGIVMFLLAARLVLPS